jgi:hypothetical protein
MVKLYNPIFLGHLFNTSFDKNSLSLKKGSIYFAMGGDEDDDEDDEIPEEDFDDFDDDLETDFPAVEEEEEIEPVFVDDDEDDDDL